MINGHSHLLELGTRLFKKQYSGNPMANGLFQQIQDGDQRQCCNISFSDRKGMVTAQEPDINEEICVI